MEFNFDKIDELMVALSEANFKMDFQYPKRPISQKLVTINANVL